MALKEARAKAMMGMGVDENDISTEGIIGKERGGATNKKLQSGRMTLTGTKKPDEKGHYSQNTEKSKNNKKIASIKKK